MYEKLVEIISEVLVKYPQATVRDSSDIAKIIANKISEMGYWEPTEKGAGCLVLSEDGSIEMKFPKHCDDEVVPRHILLMGGLAIKLTQSEFLEEIMNFVHEKNAEFKNNNLY